MDCSLQGCSVHGIFQAIVLEWIAISFSGGSSHPRDQTQVSRIIDRRFTVWATREVLITYEGSFVGTVVKNPSASAGDVGDEGWIPGSRRSPGRKWQPTSVFLSEKSQRQRSLVGYSTWGHKESDTTEHAHTTVIYVTTYLFTHLNRHLFICLYLYMCRYTSAYRCICIYMPSVYLL